MSCLEEIPEGAVIDGIAKEMSAVASQDSTAAADGGHTSAGKPDSDSQTTTSCDSKSAKQLAVSPENRPAAANQTVVSCGDSRPAATSQPVASQDSMSANQLDAVPLLLPSLTCYARWREDRVWYRCQILCDHGDEVEVIFTDYGNQDRVVRRTELVLLPTDIPAGEDKDVNVLEELEAVKAVLADKSSGQSENNPDPIATSSLLSERPGEAGDSQGAAAVPETSRATEGSDEKTLISDEKAIVLAQWQEDSVWYRARIQGKTGRRRVCVSVSQEPGGHGGDFVSLMHQTDMASVARDQSGGATWGRDVSDLICRS